MQFLEEARRVRLTVLLRADGTIMSPQPSKLLDYRLICARMGVQTRSRVRGRVEHVVVVEIDSRYCPEAVYREICRRLLAFAPGVYVCMLDENGNFVTGYGWTKGMRSEAFCARIRKRFEDAAAVTKNTSWANWDGFGDPFAVPGPANFEIVAVSREQ